MKKLKSFYLNTNKKYTKWGLICNWGITIIPFIFLGVSFWVGNSLKDKNITTDNIKTILNGGDVASLLAFLLVFIVFIYLILYKFIRMIKKPKKIRSQDLKNGVPQNRAERKRAKNEARSNKDKYWGNE